MAAERTIRSRERPKKSDKSVRQVEMEQTVGEDGVGRGTVDHAINDIACGNDSTGYNFVVSLLCASLNGLFLVVQMLASRWPLSIERSVLLVTSRADYV
eukprot:1308406-Amphidinium_carterae.1